MTLGKIFNAAVLGVALVSALDAAIVPATAEIVQVDPSQVCQIREAIVYRKESRLYDYDLETVSQMYRENFETSISSISVTALTPTGLKKYKEMAQYLSQACKTLHGFNK